MTIPRFFLTWLVLISPFTIFAQDAAQDAAHYAESISVETLQKHLKILAADDMEGRETGQPGMFKAANYIKEEFQKLGLKPIVPAEYQTYDYFQNFNLYKKGWTNAHIKVGNNKKIFFKDYYPVGMINIPEEITDKPILAGYGIHEDQYSDYRELDIKNKSVLIFENTPPDILKLLKIDDNINENKKADQAFKLGAKAVFIISTKDENSFNTAAAERKAILSRYNRMMLKATENTTTTDKPVFIISKRMAAEIMGISIKKLNKIYLKGLNSTKRTIESQTISFVSKRDNELVKSVNILGFLEGSEKPEEVLVITAHFDHVGVDNKGQIYNGADDDGSGTAAVISMAEAFTKAYKDGHKPYRSILFMTVSGEEKGLLGSQYFTDIEPIVPLKNIVADLNIDMIGRIDKDHTANEKYVYLIGADKLSSELQFIADSVNKNFKNYQLDYTYNDPKDPNRFYYRSDHYNFAKNKIPIIFYFTGVHEDYHQPGDDEYKIMYPKYRDITQYIFLTAWQLANRKDRIKVDSDKP